MSLFKRRHSIPASKFFFGVAALLALVRFLLPMSKASAVFISPFYSVPASPITYGTAVDISWFCDAGDSSELYNANTGQYLGSGYGSDGQWGGPYSSGPLYTSTSFRVKCQDNQLTRYERVEALLTIEVPCPWSNFESPWNANASYLIRAGGVGSVTNSNGRFCIRNYSSNAIFIPMNSIAEWNSFNASASGLGVGVSAF